MNINPLILQLHTATNLPVEQDAYEGDSTSFITFTYEDERSALNSDNCEQITEVTVMVNLFTPKDTNYFALKNQIKNKLTELGFTVVSIRSFLNGQQGTSRMRQTSFSATYQG